MTARHLYHTTLELLVTLVLVGGYMFLVDQTPFGTQPLPSRCRLAVAYLSLPARGHDPRRPVAPTTQLVAGLERIVGRCVDGSHHGSAPAYDDGQRRPKAATSGERQQYTSDEAPLPVSTASR
jgi:hypothetical protein